MNYLEIKQNRTKTSSLIELSLWDSAKWNKNHSIVERHKERLFQQLTKLQRNTKKQQQLL